MFLILISIFIIFLKQQSSIQCFPLPVDNDLQMASSGNSFGSKTSAPIGPIQVPVYTQHKIKIKPANPKAFNAVPPVVFIEANPIPLKIVLKSESSNFIVEQSHKGKPGGMKQSTSIEKPWIVKQYIRRPIIHTVHEKIIPIRNVVQEFLPPKESIKSIFTGRVKPETTSEPPPLPPIPVPGVPKYATIPPPTPTSFPPESTTQTESTISYDSGDNFFNY